MKHAHRVQQILQAEKALMAQLPPGTLMQRAAAGLATACADFLGRVYGTRIVVIAGTGDNGGDALWAAARLARRGAAVEAIVLDSKRVHSEGLAALIAAGGRVVDGPDGHRRAIERADLAIDGIVGIGGKPGLRKEATAVVEHVERFEVPTVAVDVPSGIDVDTGETPGPHVKADLTVTFGTYRVAHFVDPGASACGTVHLVDIGLTDSLPAPAVEVLQPPDVAARFPVPGRDSHKYTRGVLGVLAGSREYTGAAVLVVGGALGGSLGMVRYVGPEEPIALVRQRWPEAVIGWGRVQAWVVGSGLGADARRAGDVSGVLADGVPVLVDADGLRHLPDRFDGSALLTPHEGELARMLAVDRDEVVARRLYHAKAAAVRWNATVLLKGATTVIATPDELVRVNTVGTPYVATAGSGDVLSGLCGSLLAAGIEPFDAAAVGCYLHETAGLLASDGGPITADDLLRFLPDAARRILRPT